MKLLDLFCGAGGAGAGYALAGFDVTGVDILPQPRYPFEFHQGCAIEFLKAHWHEFDVIHASPPCQAHSSMTSLTSRRNNVDLIPETRATLKETGLPYVIENVPGSSLVSPVMLCGVNFGLSVARHRIFESNLPIMGHSSCDHSGRELYTVLTKSCRKIGDLRGPSSHDTGKKAMGVSWMTQKELGESIPPAYTEYIGSQLLLLMQ